MSGVLRAEVAARVLPAAQRRVGALRAAVTSGLVVRHLDETSARRRSDRSSRGSSVDRPTALPTDRPPRRPPRRGDTRASSRRARSSRSVGLRPLVARAPRGLVRSARRTTTQPGPAAPRGTPARTSRARRSDAHSRRRPVSFFTSASAAAGISDTSIALLDAFARRLARLPARSPGRQDREDTRTQKKTKSDSIAPQPVPGVSP